MFVLEPRADPFVLALHSYEIIMKIIEAEMNLKKYSDFIQNNSTVFRLGKLY